MKYRYIAPWPNEGDGISEWRVYGKQLQAMSDWIYEQKWDHWERVKTLDGEGFSFAYKEHYTWFVLRFSS